MSMDWTGPKNPVLSVVLKVTAVTNGDIIRMRRAGFTYKEIASKAGLPETTIASRCQRWGIRPEIKVIRERNRKSTHQYPWWLLHMMYWDCELSTVEIGYELELSPSSVLGLMRRLGVPTRTRLEARKVFERRFPEKIAGNNCETHQQRELIAA